VCAGLKQNIVVLSQGLVHHRGDMIEVAEGGLGAEVGKANILCSCL
jgi:hypothetical protein